MAAIVSAFNELIQFVILYSLRGRSANPWLAALVYLCLGSAIGVWIAGLFLIRPFPPTAALLVPIIGGLLAHAFGKWAQARGHEGSWLATFWGGAAFHARYYVAVLDNCGR
ncbi:MAG: hypothetical protein JNK87_33330 [Bryobacterales bacterium]|nr:hypothetical protein [Bryobacterales bacterium]